MCVTDGAMLKRLSVWRNPTDSITYMPTEIFFPYFVKITDPNIFFIVATKLIVLFLIYLPTYRPPNAPTDFFSSQKVKNK